MGPAPADSVRRCCGVGRPGDGGCRYRALGGLSSLGIGTSSSTAAGPLPAARCRGIVPASRAVCGLREAHSEDKVVTCDESSIGASEGSVNDATRR